MSKRQERDDMLLGIFDTMRTVAIVGASAKPERPSYMVMKALQSHGVRVIPVNPGLAGQTLLGCTVYASLGDIEDDFDVVDIFRAPDAALEVVREAIRLMDKKDIQVVWLQLGIRNDQAVAEAEAAGLIAVQDRCIKIDYERLVP
ncbi:MAG: CoA-binding protein [Rhodospirillales bacterium]|nr:CoA-binding protein [Rhodospirillales bacterium]